MPREIKGILVSRLLVLISIIAVPIATFLIFAFVDFKLWFSDDPVLTFWLIKVLSPTVYSVSWLFFLILFANRFAETIEAMDRIAGFIPLRLKLFYGINALFLLMIFVFPLITPVVSVLSFASFGWRLTTFRKEDWEDSKVSRFTKFVMILFAILPVAVFSFIILDFLALPLFLWFNVWVPLLLYIETMSYCLCTALAIGSLFILLSNKGVSEIEQIYTDPSQQKSTLPVKLFELVLFVFLFILALYGFTIVDFFYYSGFVIVAVVAIVNYFSGRKKKYNFKGHVLGYLLAAIFMSSTIFTFAPEISSFIKYSFLIILSSVFILLFIYTFVRMEEEDF